MIATCAALMGAAALGVTAVPAATPSPAGDWVGTLHAPGRDYRLGLEVRRSPHGYTALYDSISLGLQPIPLRLAPAAGGPAFDRKFLRGAFAARWDPAAGAWRGEWRAGRQRYPVLFHPGPIPAAPAMTKADEIAVAVIGALMALEAAAIAWLIRARRRRGGRSRATARA